MCVQWRLKSASASAHSNQSLRFPHEETLHPWISKNAPSVDSDQPAHLRRLICIYAGRTCSKIRFLTFRLICARLLQLLIDWVFLMWDQFLEVMLDHKNLITTAIILYFNVCTFILRYMKMVKYLHVREDWSWNRLIMKSLQRSFSPFRWFKKGKSWLLAEISAHILVSCLED